MSSPSSACISGGGIGKSERTLNANTMELREKMALGIDEAEVAKHELWSVLYRSRQQRSVLSIETIASAIRENLDEVEIESLIKCLKNG